MPMENYIQLPAPNHEKVSMSQLPFEWPPPEYLTMELGDQDDDLVIRAWREGDDQVLQMKRTGMHHLGGQQMYARYEFAIPFIARTFE